MRSALRSARADEDDRLAQIFDLFATAFHGPRVLRAVPGARDELRIFADRAFSVFDEPAVGLGLVLIAIVIAVNALAWTARRAGERLAG